MVTLMSTMKILLFSCISAESKVFLSSSKNLMKDSCLPATGVPNIDPTYDNYSLTSTLSISSFLFSKQPNTSCSHLLDGLQIVLCTNIFST